MIVAPGRRRWRRPRASTIRDDAGLLDEVVGLVEWPVVMIGRIDDAFMAVPPEVLITAMRTHQKYFSLLDGAGAMAPRFVVVANTEASDGGAQVIAGNERVLRARLADAKFFWDQDRKKTLESRVPQLAERIFHAKLGTDRGAGGADRRACASSGRRTATPTRRRPNGRPSCARPI